MSNDTILVQTTFELRAQAEAMKRGLQKKFHASPSIKPMRSIYRWTENGTDVQDVSEEILTAIIDRSDYKDVEALIAKTHKYDLPCIIAMPLTAQQDHATSTDCVMAKVVFNNEADAVAAARDLVESRLSAGAKICRANTDTRSLDWPASYLVSAETTREAYALIEQSHPHGKISNWSMTPIIEGEEKFMQWIRDCCKPSSLGPVLQELLPPRLVRDNSLSHQL
jgi:uncharacterized protein involved in tolerance to divalent cations